MKRINWFTLSRFDDDGTVVPPVEGTDGSVKPPEKTLTQADVDRIVADRLNRERQKFSDYEDLKTKATKLDELEAANATEAERLATAKDAAEKRAEVANKTAVDAIARAVRAEVKALADGFADRDDAVLNLGDLSQYIKDGDVDTASIEVALAEVLDRKKHLAKAAVVVPIKQPAPDVSQGRGGDNKPSDFRSAPAEEFGTELAKYGLRPRT